jgi:hypothetical protein
MIEARTTLFLRISHRENREMSERIVRFDDYITAITEERARRGPCELRAICERLQRLGVVKVEVGYSGGGDDGAVDDLLFLPEGTTLPSDLEDAVADWVTDFLPPGWANDEGGQGTVVIDVVASVARFNHGQNVAEIVWENFEIGGDDQ